MDGHGHFIKEAKDDAKSVHILFSPNESVGALAESLKIFKVLLALNIVHK